jgi:hypothetical protein
MIKTGDKVICINDVDHYAQSLKKDSIYNIIYYAGNGYEFYENGHFDKIPVFFPLRRRRFSQYRDKKYDELIFNQIRSYIMSLAEWREEQIKSIIDD